MKNKELIMLLLKWAGRDRYLLYLSVILAFISGLFTMVPYYAVYRIMVAVYARNLTQHVIVENSIIILAAMALRFAIFGAAGAVSHKGAYRALFRVRCIVVEHMAKIPLGALNTRSIGDVKTVLNEDIEKLELFLAHQLPEFVYYLIGPFAVFVYLCFVNAPLALVSLLPLILGGVAIGLMYRSSSGMVNRFNASLVSLNSVMIEYISGMKLIKAYNMGSSSFRKYADAIQEENDVWIEGAKSMGPPYAAFVVFIECGMIFMVPFGGMFFLNGSITASVFILFMFVGGMYLTEVRPLHELGSNFADVLKGIEKAREVLEIQVFEGGGEFPEKHDIELRNVTFSYDGSSNVIRDCNLQISDGEKIGIAGRSGAGKSTIVELISRFYDVDKGEILIGGKDIRDINYEILLQNIAIVFQKTFLTRDSVFENIRMGANATLKEVREAAVKAQIDDFIMSLPDEYDTKVGSFSTRFSGGEKQRIAIARAILKNAPILILDEATASSDPENQLEIDKAICNLCMGKTVIIVAHRLGVLKSCDRVAVIENRRVTTIGSHDEVLKNNDYYRQAWSDYEIARNITYQL
ncbi:ABC transporter related protein [Denitrovibrio acetiphilus DSM 12809]|uniref:ABC transporter related protein n=2 Tax=Denitrovibrio TaxID=117999 RepID=D4H688_DENA2|nr:ABC transporter ATP-binding protein [Denitrovibrio acetiphilus]ADD67734.1 ABC transporter related protein [Denitrovibrio acetiphilus DSM 12809]